MAIDDNLERARLHPDVLKNLNKNKKLKVAEPYSEDNPPPYPITSVNGQTGDVNIPTVDLPVSVQDGGTGADNAADARTNLGLGSVATENVVPLNKGGTGADNAADARENLGLVRTLLWTNPDPYTLAAGTHNFSMSGYSQVEIECTRTGSTSGTYFVRSGIGTSSSAVTVDLTTIRLDTTKSGFNAITLMTRTADVYSTGIVFSSGQMIYDGTYYKDWDNRAVPYRVWGIR